jgi:hypothetical protein
VKGRLLLDVVVRKGAAVLELLAGEDKALLVGRDTVRSQRARTKATSAGTVSPLLVLDLGLDIVNGVRGLDLEGDGLSRERLHEDLHGWGC